MSLGTYPAISLAEARRRREKARAQIIQGDDPLATKAAKRQASANTFERVARDWYEVASQGKNSKYYLNMTRLERYIFPAHGRQLIDEIEPPELLDSLMKIVARGHLETAHKTRRVCSQVFRYAIATRRGRYNPASDLAQALPSPDNKHYAAVTDPAAVGELLRAVWSYEGVSIMVSYAIRTLPYLFVRPGNLIKMQWEHVDLAAGEWMIPAAKMKMNTDHMVPLPTQVIEILTELRSLSGHNEWAFTGRSPKRPLSANTLNSALRTLGINTKEEHTSHGWRATARTLLHERLNYPPEIIERQLAHRVPDMLGEAYNRTRFIEERRKMMQAYADYLDCLRYKTIPANGI